MFDPVELARAAVYTYLTTGTLPTTPTKVPAQFSAPAGAFVSMKKGGDLRGCIGTFMPTQQSVAQEIIHNAIKSAAQDPRFAPVTIDELEEIEFSVDVLESPEPVASLSELDHKLYGVIVTSGERRGLLLPDLEGVDSVEEQIAIAQRKARIAEWEAVEISRFKVTRYR